MAYWPNYFPQKTDVQIVQLIGRFGIGFLWFSSGFSLGGPILTAVSEGFEGRETRSQRALQVETLGKGR